jgi:hypothetical protein
MTLDSQEIQIEGRAQLVPPHGLKREEHYALYLVKGMAAAGSGCLTDSDIDYAIDMAERLANRLVERGHIQPHEK